LNSFIEHTCQVKKLSKFADTSVYFCSSFPLWVSWHLALRYLGLHELIVAIPHEMEVYFEFVPWIIFLGPLRFVEDEIDGLFSKPIPNSLVKTAAPK
jgi:hypothetical protein